MTYLAPEGKIYLQFLFFSTFFVHPQLVFLPVTFLHSVQGCLPNVT